MHTTESAGLVAVAARELRWIWRDRVALILVTLIPLIAFALLAATFSSAVIRNLPVDAVDQDRSAPRRLLFRPSTRLPASILPCARPS